MTTDDDRRLTRREASDYLTMRGFRVAPTTLAKYASVGGGPVFRCFGRKPLYRPADLVAWVEARTTGPLHSTSDKCAA